MISFDHTELGSDQKSIRNGVKGVCKLKLGPLDLTGKDFGSKIFFYFLRPALTPLKLGRQKIQES